MTTDSAILSIDVVADVVCPWCYIGERRLARALKTVQRKYPALELAVRWRPFQLQPNLPPDGMPWQDFVEAKFGGPQRAQAMFRHVRTVGREDDITFRFDRITRAPNTTDAHRLIGYASAQGHEWAMVEALFAAYFEHGRDLNNLDDLADTAQEAGLAGEAARVFLRSNKGRDAVWQRQQEAYQLGIRGVPFYVFDGRYGVSGAQPVKQLVQAIDQVIGEQEQEAAR